MTYKLVAVAAGQFEVRDYPSEEQADIAFIAMKGTKDHPKVRHVPVYVEVSHG